MAELRSQIRISTSDEVGKLAAGAGLLARAGVNILSLCAWVEGTTGHMLLITDDNEKACSVLKGAVDKCEMGEVVTVMVPNKPGAMQAGGDALAKAGINVKHIHATAAGSDALIVLDTSDNAQAVKILG